MLESKGNYTVVRDYQCLYDAEELVRRIIRGHLGEACEREKASECAGGRGDGHAQFSR